MNSGRKQGGPRAQASRLRPGLGGGRAVALAGSSAPAAPLGSELSQIRRDSQACLRPEPAIPSALAPNAVNGFSELPNRQLPPVLAASRSSGAPAPPGRALRALASLLAAEQAARVSELFVGRPARSLLVSQPHRPPRAPASLAASTPQPASEWGHCQAGVWSLPLLGGAPAALLTHGLGGGGRARWE